MLFFSKKNKIREQKSIVILLDFNKEEKNHYYREFREEKIWKRAVQKELTFSNWIYTVMV